MANHKSAEKRIRANEAKRVRNRYYHKTARNAVRSFRKLTDQKEAAKQYPALVSMLDKLAKKSVIHRNKASNLKSKLSLFINRLAA